MLSPFILLALAAPAPAPPTQTALPPALPIRELFQGPMPVSDKVLPPRHANSDERMFPDIAIGEMKVDGDTLYVRVLNKGASSTPGPVLVAAQAEENGSKTALVEQRTARLLPGEARWVPLRGFSIKTASATPAVFALRSASAVAAVARLMPSGTSALDRSGQSREVGTAETDEANNSLTLAGSSIEQGRPN